MCVLEARWASRAEREIAPWLGATLPATFLEASDMLNYGETICV